MSTPISLFDYHLPPEQIAQFSVTPRDSSKLLVLNRTPQPGCGKNEPVVIRHRVFREIVDELVAGDVLVMNNTKVFKARLSGTVSVRGKKIGLEVFLLRGEGTRWSALVRPGKKVALGDWIDLRGMIATVVEKRDDGVVTLEMNATVDEVIAFADAHGEIPVPPYVDKAPEKLDDYQTVYAKTVGSVAAPTAGFHFTDALIATLKAKGVQFEFVTLHVGIGTFRPVKTDTLEEHQMHAEFVSIDAETAGRINAAKREGRRVVAVGTTTVRVLEGVCEMTRSSHLEYTLSPDGFSGDVNIFITPGFDFKVIDALITNFHLPKSTLLVLVSAFAGRDNVVAAYEEAVRLGYRFFSFGDAMFIR